MRGRVKKPRRMRMIWARAPREGGGRAGRRWRDRRAAWPLRAGLSLCLLLAVSLAGGQSPEPPPDPPRIRRIEIRGAEQIPPGRVRDAMRLRQDEWWRPFAKNYFYGADHLAPDLERIIDRYRSEGFLFVRIEEAVVRHLSRDEVVIEIRLHEGPRLHVREAVVRSQDAVLRRRLAPRVTLERGEPLYARDLQESETRLRELCDELGYALASITRELRIAGDSAEVRFHVDAGPLVRVGGLEVRGTQRTRPEVVRREVVLERDDVLRRSRVLYTRDRLFDLGLFRTVRIAPDDCDSCVTMPEEGAMQVDLQVTVGEKPPGWYGGGAGFSSESEIRLLGEWGYRNLQGRGRGIQLGVLASWSLQAWEERHIDDPTERQVELILSEPWLFGTPLRGQLSTTYRFNREASFSEEIFSIEFGARRDLSRFRALLASIERKWVWSSDPSTAGRDYEIPSLSLSFREDRRDFVLDPRTGRLLQLRVDYAGGLLGGPIDFTRWAVGASFYLPWGERTRFAYRIRGGYLHPWGDAIAGVARSDYLRQLPYDERFRAGGATTVRGHAIESLGPPADDGQSLGGLALLLLNAELRFPLRGPLEAALFLDAGNVWAHYRQLSWSRLTAGLTAEGYEPANLSYAAGGGLRFRTPVGPLRLDLGWKLNRARRPGSSGAELHFTLGQAF
ncbi:MAG: BamA/TamA family outer membrane protein [Candidatus Eisenbacteria bacterium]|nr:BamA/TamA family outer membrane protein [Candidatus Eisenbacteria bacterium]